MDPDAPETEPTRTRADEARAGERELLAALRRGDEAAFETLVRDEGPRMLAVARGLLRDDGEAQDAVQEAFLKAFESIDRFEGKSKLGTWLHRIAVNAALMRLRSRSRKPEGSIEDLLPSFKADGHAEHPAVPWTEPADAAAQRAEVRRLVRESIERLPDNYRNVLWLRDIEGFDLGDLADSLGITRNAVKIRLHRARMALRELLDPLLRATP